MTHRIGLGFLLAMLSGGCGYMAPSVQVMGTSRNLETLNGEWWGDYVGDRDSDRRGTITFRLLAGESAARGDVVMTPAGSPQPLARPSLAPATTNPDAPAPSSVLTIRFVGASDGMVYGELDPFLDPERRVEAMTTFRGDVRGDTITGTFRTTYVNGAPQTTGRWQVTRKKRNQS